VIRGTVGQAVAPPGLFPLTAAPSSGAAERENRRFDDVQPYAYCVTLRREDAATGYFFRSTMSNIGAAAPPAAEAG
jgi:hypothetical protein